MVIGGSLPHIPRSYTNLKISDQRTALEKILAQFNLSSILSTQGIGDIYSIATLLIVQQSMSHLSWELKVGTTYGLEFSLINPFLKPGYATPHTPQGSNNNIANEVK